eukprot:TRINITY_DN473_c0_g1_i10.p1 TRINITY_DN473_c0_g1~~TRINITY_DN473_c0_g1_i10.p1  ORF type:complete len:384 (-),score=27.73 TRINITY_DN473_c0_g1_i10:192-1343(-)
MSLSSTFNGTLTVTVVDAKDLVNLDYGRQDPYCKITIGSSGFRRLLEGDRWGKEHFTTRTHEKGGSNPVWNETHTVNITNMQLESHLKVSLYDRDAFKDDYIGIAKVNLNELLHSQSRTCYYDLIEKKALKQANPKPVGRVGINVRFNCTEIPQMKGGFKNKVADIRRHKRERRRGLGPVLTQEQLQSEIAQPAIGVPFGTTGTQSGVQTAYPPGHQDEIKDQGITHQSPPPLPQSTQSINQSTQPGLHQDQDQTGYESRYPTISRPQQPYDSQIRQQPFDSQIKPLRQGVPAPHGVTDFPGNQGPTGARPEERLLLDQQKQQLSQQEQHGYNGQDGQFKNLDADYHHHHHHHPITEGQASLGLPIHPLENSGYNQQQPVNRA